METFFISIYFLSDSQLIDLLELIEFKTNSFFQKRSEDLIVITA